MKHADVIAKLSLREKCALLSGATVFETHALPNKGVPAIWLSDGPNGLRKQAGPADHLGLNPSESRPPASPRRPPWPTAGTPPWARRSAKRWARRPLRYERQLCCWAPA